MTPSEFDDYQRNCTEDSGLHVGALVLWVVAVFIVVVVIGVLSL